MCRGVGVGGEGQVGADFECNQVLRRGRGTQARCYSGAEVRRPGVTAGQRYAAQVLQRGRGTQPRCYSGAEVRGPGVTAGQRYAAKVLQRGRGTHP
eukprot:162263-Chlamydomonas_euryale.AAC.6